MEQIIEGRTSMQQEEINQAILFRESIRAIIPKVDLEDASIFLWEKGFLNGYSAKQATIVLSEAEPWRHTAQ